MPTREELYTGSRTVRPTLQHLRGFGSAVSSLSGTVSRLRTDVPSADADAPDEASYMLTTRGADQGGRSGTCLKPLSLLSGRPGQPGSGSRRRVAWESRDPAAPCAIVRPWGAHAIKGWVLNPDDPRAPSSQVWASMTEEERAEVVASLPAEPPALQLMGEGDVHYDATDEARKALRRLFGHRGRSVYVGTGMTVYYPDESPFSPDIFAVLDVETHARRSWVVAKEGRGLDFVLEVCVSGDRSKDTVRNVVLYASLGIREYFVLLPERQVLLGHRLGDNDRYVALAPHHGRLASQVLDLELALDAGKVRFFTQGAPLPFQQELVD